MIESQLTGSPEQRFNHCIKEIREHQKVWILTDDDGCVMLNTDDEDCVPIWPSEYSALQWANGEWEHCKALAILWNEWKSRWTQGLIDDDLCIVVFPFEEEEGVVTFPEDFEQMINKKKR